MKMPRYSLVTIMIIFAVLMTIQTGAFAGSLYYEPEYSSSASTNSEYMNYYFQEFADLQWYKDTALDVMTFLDNNGLTYEIEREDGKIEHINLGTVTNGSFDTELLQIRTKETSLTMNYLTLDFDSSSGSALLSGASFITPESVAKVKAYFNYYYDLDDSRFTEKDSQLVMLSADYFIISIIPLSDDCTYVAYMITPDTLYY